MNIIIYIYIEILHTHTHTHIPLHTARQRRFLWPGPNNPPPPPPPRGEHPVGGGGGGVSQKPSVVTSHTCYSCSVDAFFEGRLWGGG